MKLRKANSDPHESRVRHYQNKSIAEIRKISPLWAYGEHCDKLFDKSQHPYFEKYSIFIVDVSDLIKNTALMDFNPETLFTNDLASDSRVATTLEQWEKNGFIDPPTICLSHQFENKLSISDGRHRTKLTYLLGAKQIPIAIHNSSVDTIRKIIELIPT